MQNKKNDKNSVSVPFTSLARKGYESTYQEFILWFALPVFEKIRLGLETQKAFAAYHKVTERTVINWKHRRDFMVQVKALRDEWGKERTGDVIAAMYKSALSGGREAPQAQKLWFQVIEGWQEKTESELTVKTELTVNDIRFVIDGLPEELRMKHYGYLRELNDDAAMVASKGIIDVEYLERRPSAEDAVREEADSDARDVSDEAGDEVAQSYSVSLRCDVEWEVQPNYYQGAARWWQEPTPGYGGVR